MGKIEWIASISLLGVTVFIWALLLVYTKIMSIEERTLLFVLVFAFTTWAMTCVACTISDELK